MSTRQGISPGACIFTSIAKPLTLSVVAIALVLAGCVHSSVIPLSQDTVQITAAAAPVCGITGAQNYASRLAAVETLRHGYDRYVIVGGQYQNDVHVMGYTPVVAQTNGSATVYSFGNTANVNGSSTTTYSGGTPIVGGSHDQALVVKMFKEAKAAKLFGSQTCCFGKERAPARAAGAQGRLFRSRYRGGPRRKVYVANQPEAVHGRLLARQIFSAPPYTGKVAHTSRAIRPSPSPPNANCTFHGPLSGEGAS